MHELINTSLPNGLIAGTHGFATAAMTRNLPDGLRVRLEQLSAYTHRTSAHDESYLRQNPVNWQHLILPKGEHVVSCILPAPFDYTGRTNRLAHHFCFTRDEFPLNGAATVIRLASDALTAAWTGEARWLVGNAALAARLAADAPADSATAAPHWEQLLGSGAGLEMAKRVAQFVCENLHTPGKSLAFRVDAEIDADGRRLLGLFADVISLLPQQMRRDVTFSTYAAALPTGMPCLLRGVYDDSATFKVVAAVQPWVDCRAGRVVHAEKLPEHSPAPAPCALSPVPVSSVQKPKLSSAKMRLDSSIDAKVQPSGTFWFILVGVSVALSLLFGGGLWFYMRRTIDTQAASALARHEADEAAKRKAAAEQENARKLEEEKRRAEQAEAEAERRRADEERRRRAEADERKRRERNTAETKKREAERSAAALALLRRTNVKRPLHGGATPEGRAAAYTNFAEQIVWRSPNPDREEDRRIFEGATNAWVYYHGGATNQIASRPCSIKAVLNKAVNQTRYVLEPNEDEVPLRHSPFVIWFQADKRKLYWQWNGIANVRFSQTNETFDVWGRLTGGSQQIAATLERGGFTLNYSLVFDKGKEPMTVDGFNGKTLAFGDVYRRYRDRTTDGKKTSAKTEGRKAELEKKIDDLAREIEKEEQSNEYKKLTEDKDKYEQLGRNIEELKKKLNGKFGLDRSGEKEKDALRQRKEKMEKDWRNLKNSSVEKLERRNARIKEKRGQIAEWKDELEGLQHAQERGGVKPEELIGRAFTIRVQGKQGGR